MTGSGNVTCNSGSFFGGIRGIRGDRGSPTESTRGRGYPPVYWFVPGVITSEKHDHTPRQAGGFPCAFPIRRPPPPLPEKLWRGGGTPNPPTH